MSTWASLFSDEMDSLVSVSLLEQQAPPATNFLTYPHPHPHPHPPHADSNPNPTARSGTPTVPPSLTSFTALHSLHSSLSPRRPDLGLRRTPAHHSQPSFLGLSSFEDLTFSTSSSPARRDGPPQSPSQRPPDPGPSVSTAGRRATDNTNSTSTSTPAVSHPLSQQQTHLWQPSANTTQPGVPGLPISSDNYHDDFRQVRPQEPNSDDFLEALATGHFSSPSPLHYSPQSPAQPQPQLDPDPPFDDLAPVSASHPQQPPALPTSFPPVHSVPEPQTHLVDPAEVGREEQGDSGHSGHDEKITVDSLLWEMPVTRTKRGRAAVSPDDSLDGPSTVKRQRTGDARRANPGRPASPRGQVPRSHHDTVVPDFGDVDSIFGNDEGDVEVFDLTISEDEDPHELVRPKEDDSIKLASFECIICLDAATNLTVTHCGHMFCAQCLHRAMHTEVTKKVCPMCRQKLELRPKDGRQPHTKSKTYFQLELKLMPSKRQGKQPARC